MRREAVAQRVQRHALRQPGRLDRRPAGSVQHGWIDRVSVIAAWEQKRLRPGEPPIRTQDTQKLRRQHHIAIPRALAVTHQNDATAAVEIFDNLSGERPKYRLNFETALMYDRCVAGDMLRTVMSSIMRRRRGLFSAISETPV